MKFKNIFNPDFQDLIREFNSAKVEYILVGGYSVIIHGYGRTTGDLDLWVKASIENHKNIQKAFGHFGLPIDSIPLEDFLNINEFDVFSFGVSPVSVDILTVVKGLTFNIAFQNSNFYEIDDNLSVRGLSKSDLIKAKIAAGRNKDLDDIENLLNG